MRFVLAVLLASGLMAAQDFPIGSKVTSITVSDHGSPVAIQPSSAKATAVIFVATQCPVSNAYNERMNALYKDYSNRGVQFVFVNSNSTEPVAEVDEHAKSKGFAFKVYKDTDSVLATKFGATVTPEVYLFNSGGSLVYHGRIDNSRELSEVKSQDARMAFDAVLAGRAVPVTTTKAFGCTIRRGKSVS